MNKEEMYQVLRDVGYTEKQIEKLLTSELTEEQYDQLIEAKAEKVNIDKKSGNLKFIKVNHEKRAEKFGRLSDGDTTQYMNIALKYFDNRCALSGEEFKSFKEGNVKNSKAKSNLSAEHVIALCQGGNDVYPNLVPTVLQYNISKNGYYLLDWWNKQKNSNETQTLYSPYRLLKLVNYMMKSLDARKQDLSLKQYEKVILTPNEIDEFLDGIEQKDKQETNNSKRKLISDVVTTVEIDEEDEKKILQTIPEMEGNIPKQSEQQREKDDDTMMDILLYDSIKMLKEDEQLIEHEEFEQLMKCLDEMYEKARGVIPFEIEVRNKILKKLEELGVEENKYTVANELLQNTEIFKVARENKNKIEEYLSQYFEEKEKQLVIKLELTKEQIQIAITNVPSILYDNIVTQKIKFYKENRPDHLKDYLEGKNNATDEFIDKLIKLQSLGIDTNRLVKVDTIESLAQKSGISAEQIKEAGLNPNDNLGRSKWYIAGVTKTIEQIEELKKLGVSFEKLYAVQDFIEKIKTLQSIGVDTNRLVLRDTIKSLAEKSGINENQIKEVGLDPNDNIGKSKENIEQAYRGKGGRKPPTKEQLAELKKLGITFQERDAINEFVQVLKILKTNGIDLKIKRNTKIKDLIEGRAEKDKILKELNEISENVQEKYTLGERLNLQKFRKIDRLQKEIKKAVDSGTQFTEDEIHTLLDQNRGKDTSRSDEVIAFMKKIIVKQKHTGEIGHNCVIDENFNEDFRHAEYSIEKESVDR